ncbi:N-acetylneuraminic acid mutarotase [Georgenia satyanarayanai]|uniref:N-acetylneuraminic acid mutarotase n=1 Tax=Georgenia satyanarayanai TaxID=860221 RepID=A0A2Y9AJP2_9MICO|nr:kelch repeat-containing protein [Georgenia satyanarayanai]PYF99672.1 N-acetylneuraminic acid mutarotase [Georgenia satyanarayanai]SSA42517.1 N-acetylneuraminic acid mutarotase [Georgenia satyanarayanai]
MTRTTARSWAGVIVLTLLASLVGTLPAASADDPQISFSLEQKRRSPQLLDGATVDGVIHPFLTADAGVTAVSWWLDDPTAAGQPVRTDTTSPFDYAPGSTSHASAPFDTAALPDGEHTITAQVTTGAGVVTREATFTTDNDVAALLTTSRSDVALTSVEGGADTGTTVDVTTSDGTARPFTATASADWLAVAPSSGTTPATVSLTAATGLPVGTHTAEVTLESPDLPSTAVTVTLTVSAAPLEDFTVMHGQDAKRSSPSPLEGAEVSGDIYPLLAPETDVTSTTWWLDDPLMGGAPVRTDGAAPFDFAPGSVRHRAEPLDTTTLADGEHTITARVTTTDGAQHVTTATFVTSNGSNALVWDPDSLVVEAAEGPGVQSVALTATEAGTVASLSSDAPWLSVTSSTVSLPGTVEVRVDPSGLAGGTHTGRLTATADGAVSAVLTVSFLVDAAPGLVVDPGALSVTALADGAPVDASVVVSASDDSALPLTVSASVPWLSADPSTTATPAQLTATADPTGLSPGTHTGELVLSSPDLPDVTVPVTLTVQDDSPFHVVTGVDAKRRSPEALAGRTVSGDIYAFLAQTEGVSSTSWWVDDPDRTGAPLRTDSTAPFDLAPGSVTHAAAPFDTTLVPDGEHTVTVEVLTADGTTHVVHTAFTTVNDTNALTWAPEALEVPATEGGQVQEREVALEATTPGTVAQVVSTAPWLSATTSQETTPATVDVLVNPAGLSAGVWHGELVATSAGAFTAVLPVTLVVGEPGGCAPVSCELIKVDTPYNLGFRYEAKGIIDVDGVGTGFTTLLPRPDGTEYLRDRLEVDLGEGTLDITGTPGSVKENTLDNALGVGFDGPTATTVLTATIAGPPATTRKYEQAGIWFGYDQNHVDRVALVSTPQGWRVEHVLEVDGTEVSRRNSPYLTIPSDVPVELSIRVDPGTRQATGYYRVGDGGQSALRSFDVPGEFFSFDAAGIDPLIGTRSFGGVFASSRSAAEHTEFRFSQFSVTGEHDPADVADYPFDRYSVPVPFPTSMAYGPDGKLYVQSMFGKIYILSFAPDGTVSDTQVVSTLGARLALGLAVDPASTPSNVIVWAGHSSPSADDGEADSSIVSRLSGPGLSYRSDVITGLPRSIANHGTNALHFGGDGRLYIAQGGNTGAGAPNTANTEFGDRAEQPLSAALLVADVKVPGFDGDCADLSDIYQSGDCDVAVFASGLRNTYDFVEHSNGHVYGPNNGLGVVGSYPPTAQAPCTGMGDTRPWTQGGHNPGNQNDVLNLIEEGRYYGHPNPSRGECVFTDGSYQDTEPLPTYTPPIGDLGANRSANGIIEFSGGAFCGALDHHLLITNYSVGDDITAVTLSADGRSVVRTQSIVGGFTDPLPIAQAPDGRIVVGEFAGSGGRITFLTPRDIGCWAEEAPLPVEVLDAGGVAIGDALYVVGGKGAAGHSTRAYRYDAPEGTWTRVADLPGPGVENPAVTTDGTHLLVVGGSTAPFSGAVATAWSYDPATDTWSPLPSMPTARGGATAQVVDGQVYVAGGMTADGGSTAVVERLDLASGTWHAAPPLTTARDNPGSAVVDGVLYVFGGRTRLSNGQTPMGTLGSMEALHPASGGGWVPRSSMPTARRTMATGVIDGRIVAVGGEARPDGLPFDATEVYDPATDEWTTARRVPTARHGAAAGVIDGHLHVVAGAQFAGAAASALHEVLTLP